MTNDSHWHILAAMPDAIVVVGADGTVKHANSCAEDLFGYTQQELEGLPLEELIPHADRRGHAEKFTGYLASPSVRPMGTGRKFRALRKDGSELPVDIALSGSQTPEGAVVVASIRDISDRVQLADALKTSVELNLSVLESLQDQIAILDRKGIVVAVNRSWDAFAEVDGVLCFASARVGADYLDMLRRAAADGDEIASRVLEGVQAVLFKGAPFYAAEYPYRRPGEERWFLLRMVELQSDKGGAVISLSDITSLKSTELRLRSALDELEQLKDRLQAESRYLREEIEGEHNFEEIVGQSPPTLVAVRKIEQVASTDASVLLTGETGTGKELFARAIHNRSLRKDRPLVKVNCASLPPSLIESELFGHVKGAFTGALADRIGRFQLADEGTLFLDEIGELDLGLQAKLLRVLQEGEFERVGSSGGTIRVNVRVIAATNRDLRKAMDSGEFRSDLYYRLAVFPIHIPTLRQRREDIPLLVWHFIDRKQASFGKRIERIPEEVMRSLVDYAWPGNIRELQNVVEQAMIVSPGTTLTLDDSILSSPKSTGAGETSSRLEDVEREHIQSVLANCGGKIKGPGGAAERLDMKPSTLRYRLKKLGIERR